MKRIFEASWSICLRVKLKSAASPGRQKTTASPTAKPFFVPPKETASTPASVVSSASDASSAAAAFASRAPSTCTSMPSSWAVSAIARVSSSV